MRAKLGEAIKAMNEAKLGKLSHGELVALNNAIDALTEVLLVTEPDPEPEPVGEVQDQEQCYGWLNDCACNYCHFESLNGRSTPWGIR